MHVKIHYPGPIEGEVRTKDENGKRVTVAQAEVTPYFFKPDGRSSTLHIEAIDGRGQVIHRYVLVMAGKTGELQLVRRSPCKPQYDLTYEEEGPALE